MKDTLQSQLEEFKRDNTRSSKEAMLDTVNSLTSSFTGNDTALNSVQEAKRALTSRLTNKDAVVQSVENVLSNLK